MDTRTQQSIRTVITLALAVAVLLSAVSPLVAMALPGGDQFESFEADYDESFTDATPLDNVDVTNTSNSPRYEKTSNSINDEASLLIADDSEDTENAQIRPAPQPYSPAEYRMIDTTFRLNDGNKVAMIVKNGSNTLFGLEASEAGGIKVSGTTVAAYNQTEWVRFQVLDYNLTNDTIYVAWENLNTSTGGAGWYGIGSDELNAGFTETKIFHGDDDTTIQNGAYIDYLRLSAPIDPTTYNIVPAPPSEGYQQTYILDDQSGRFPPDRSTLTVSEWDPGAKSIADPSESDEWSEIATKSFNANNETRWDLTDGDYYKLTVTGPTGDTWELIGIQANETNDRERLTILPIQQGTPTPTPTASPTPGVTPFPTPTPTATPGVTPFPSPTPPTGFGPTALGYCEVPNADERGLEVEYFDPDDETVAFNYHLTGPDNDTVYSGTKTFEEPIGYYRGCIAPATLNDTDPDDVDGTYNGSRDDGSTFNGSLSWPEPDLGGGFGGPVGGGEGGTSSATTFGGWLLLLAGGYLAYRRFGDGQVGRAISNASQQVSGLLGR
jgi:hypothetical protein